MHIRNLYFIPVTGMTVITRFCPCNIKTTDMFYIVNEMFYLWRKKCILQESFFIAK